MNKEEKGTVLEPMREELRIALAAWDQSLNPPNGPRLAAAVRGYLAAQQRAETTPEPLRAAAEMVVHERAAYGWCKEVDDAIGHLAAVLAESATPPERAGTPPTAHDNSGPPYTLDGMDPVLRDLVVCAVHGAMATVAAPPPGHWLTSSWQLGRAETPQASPEPSGWKFTRIDSKPFLGIVIEAPNGYATDVYSHERNPGNILYMLADALLASRTDGAAASVQKPALGHQIGASAEKPAAVGEPLCMCKDRALSQCPGEWEPGCDLGANEKFARVGRRK